MNKYEKMKDSKVAFDPDGDNFNFGYDMALTLKVRVNMIKIIRKEILANNFKFWEHRLENLIVEYGTAE